MFSLTSSATLVAPCQRSSWRSALSPSRCYGERRCESLPMYSFRDCLITTLLEYSLWTSSIILMMLANILTSS